jgi:hypothetical protein
VPRMVVKRGLSIVFGATLMLAACSPRDQTVSQLTRCQREAVKATPEDWARPGSLAAFYTESCMRDAGYTYDPSATDICAVTRIECYHPVTLRRRIGL